MESIENINQIIEDNDFIDENGISLNNKNENIESNLNINIPNSSSKALPLVIFENYLKSQDIEKDLSSIEYQDVAPILYLYYEMNGYPEYTYIKHLIIDEAQDYTKLQYMIIRNIFKKSKFG